MSKDTSKLDEILQERYGNDITHADCGDECMERQNYQDLKADLLAWHREECEKIIGDMDEYDKKMGAGFNRRMSQRNGLRHEQHAELRASLEEK